MSYYNGAFERDRQQRMTPEKIVQIAKSAGSFSVSLRYRDDWLRKRCRKLREEGLLIGGKRRGRDLYYYPVEQGRNR